jgi:hypothetical protein
MTFHTTVAAGRVNDQAGSLSIGERTASGTIPGKGAVDRVQGFRILDGIEGTICITVKMSIHADTLTFRFCGIKLNLAKLAIRIVGF